jgi:hypothetical protein
MCTRRHNILRCRRQCSIALHCDDQECSLPPAIARCSHHERTRQSRTGTTGTDISRRAHCAHGTNHSTRAHTHEQFLRWLQSIGRAFQRCHSAQQVQAGRQNGQTRIWPSLHCQHRPLNRMPAPVHDHIMTSTLPSQACCLAHRGARQAAACKLHT